jgi:hypothetical protein
MKQVNINGTWMWDQSARCRIIYVPGTVLDPAQGVGVGRYAHIKCVSYPHERLQETNTRAGYLDSQRDRVCYVCGLDFVPQVMTADQQEPGHELNQHFI